MEKIDELHANDLDSAFEDELDYFSEDYDHKKIDQMVIQPFENAAEFIPYQTVGEVMIMGGERLRARHEPSNVSGRDKLF